MAWTGSSMRVDPETGFLVPSKNYSMVGFGADKKLKFLELFRQAPDVGACARAIGFHRETVMEHMKIDSEFKARFESIVDECSDQLEAVMYENAKTSRGFMDRIAWLRAHRGNKYNPRTMIINESGKDNLAQVLSKMTERGEILEVVEQTPDTQPTQLAPPEEKQP